MPYGTNSFTDRYGDFKQPSVIDYDKESINNRVINPHTMSVEDSLKIHEGDKDLIFKEILDFNPFFAGDRYLPFVISNNGKLAWDVQKLESMKSNSEWLFSLRQYLNKAKNKFISNKKP